MSVVHALAAALTAAGAASAQVLAVKIPLSAPRASAPAPSLPDHPFTPSPLFPGPVKRRLHHWLSVEARPQGLVETVHTDAGSSFPLR